MTQPDGSVLAWDDGKLYRVYPGDQRVEIVLIARFPVARYAVVQVEGGWEVYEANRHEAVAQTGQP